MPQVRREPPGAARSRQDVDRQRALLDARPRRGTWVQPEEKWNLLDPDVFGWLLERKYSPALLIEFTEMRLAVEPGGRGARGPGRRTRGEGRDQPAESSACRRLIVVMMIRSTPTSLFTWPCCGPRRNRFYAQLTGFTATALRFSIRTTNRYKGVRLASVADHKKVADAIIAGKAGAGARSDAQVDPGSAGSHSRGGRARRPASVAAAGAAAEQRARPGGTR